MATKWRLAKSLLKLRDQINAAHPSRSKVSDGSIGDTAHSSRTSDHNPNGKGVVTAIDITHDPANGVNGRTLAESLLQDSRIKYLIFAGRIWKARTGRWEIYTGANRHDKHVHISVVADAKGYDSTAAWNLGSKPKEISLEEKLSDAEKGVTTSSKPASETEGTPPPAPAVELKASQPSLMSKIASLGMPAGAGGVIMAIYNFVQNIPPWGWVVLGGVFIVAFVIGAWLYNESMKRAQARTALVMSAAADKDKNNLRLI